MQDIDIFVFEIEVFTFFHLVNQLYQTFSSPVSLLNLSGRIFTNMILFYFSYPVMLRNAIFKALDSQY